MGEHTSKALKNEQGAVAVIVAICLVVFLGFTAMVVDYGYLAYVQRKLQTAADAAALAGAQEIIYGGDPEVVARNYAFDNDVKDTDTLTIAVDDEEEEVRVTVSRDVGLFFGPVLGMSTNTRIAKAKAKVVWVSGLNGLVPFGVTDERGDVWAGVNGSFTHLSDSEDNDSIFTGDIPVTGAGSQPVTIEIRDLVTGVVLGTPFEQVTAVMVEPSPVNRSNISPNFMYLSDPKTVSAYLAIESTSTPSSVAISINGISYPLVNTGTDSYGDNRYEGSFDPPTATGSYAVNAEIVENPGDPVETVGPIDYIRVADNHSTVGEVSVSLSTSTVVSGGTASLEVTIDEFRRGSRYDLKWGSDPESGNFMAVRFDDEQGGNEYKDHIENGSSSDYFIGDIITTEPGNMQGPTWQALKDRIGSDTCSWNGETLSWEDSSGNFHADCPRLVLVPLVGGYTEAHGTYDMAITGFANFFIDYFDRDGHLVGYFVEFPEVGSEWTPDDPGDPLRPRTVRLMPFD